MMLILCLLLHTLQYSIHIQARRFNVNDFGARPDADSTTGTDNTWAFRDALQAASLHVADLRNTDGAEVYVPSVRDGGGIYLTSPVNVTSNVILRVDGTLRGIPDESAYPIVDVLPSYGKDLDTRGPFRRHPLVWSVHSNNVTICGSGTIDGMGSYWWQRWSNQTLQHGVGRPHLVEIYNCSGITIAGPGLTLLNSAFWTLHPIYSRHVHIHDINILVPSCQTWNNDCGINTDGIDVDSSQNVIIENNYISCGDDHVTVLSGWGDVGRRFGMPSKNVTVRRNVLGTGMGLSIGSSVSGGIENVRYVDNIMRETREQWGQGVHIKTRIGNGGYIRDVVWANNVYYSTGTEAVLIEADYQSSGECDQFNCTLIRDIVLRDLVFYNASRPGTIKCSDRRPCDNITFDNVRVDAFYHNEWSCSGVSSGTFDAVKPDGLRETCGRGLKMEKLVE